MKKKILILLAIVFSTSSIVYAENWNNQNFGLQQWVNKMSNISDDFSDWNNAKVIFCNYLASPDDTAIKFELYQVIKTSGNTDEEIGYFITDLSNSIIEFSANTSPYSHALHKAADEKTKVELYYRPGYHGIKFSGESMQRAETKDFDYINFVQKNNIESNNIKLKINPQKGVIERYKKINGVPDYNYHISCIPTAIGNLLGYWGGKGYPKLLPGGDTMIQEINSYMNPNTDNSEIPVAIHSYCHKFSRYPLNFTATNLWGPSFDTYKQQIDANKPVLLGFASGGAYSGAHMTVGIGYYYEIVSLDRYVYVHDAWATTPVDYFVMWSSYNDFITKVNP